MSESYGLTSFNLIKKLTSCILILLMFNIPIVRLVEDYCYSEDREQYFYFGTKTSYEFVHGNESDNVVIESCKPIYFWSLNRHGTRLPSKSNIVSLRNLNSLKDEIINNFDINANITGNGRLCEQDLKLFRRWSWNESIIVNNANDLTDNGFEEIVLLAKRYINRYPELLNLPYSKETHKFQRTDSKRTRDTYLAYVTGLFNEYANQSRAEINDSLLRAYKNCPKWEEVSYNDNIEYNKFLQTPDFTELINNVSIRLGFNRALNGSIIKNIFDMCRYEKSWNTLEPSTWCSAFTKEQILLLEYGEDLSDNYKTGYGNALNAEIGCQTVQELYQNLQRIVNGNASEERVSIYFTHSTTIQLFLTAMGLFKDNITLTGENYSTQMTRQWRTSLISPFSANAVAVLYECEQGAKHRVKFFINENPVGYSGCDDGLCSWEAVSKNLKSVAENCNKNFCNNMATSKSISSLLLSLSVLLFLAFKLFF